MEQLTVLINHTKYFFSLLKFKVKIYNNHVVQLFFLEIVLVILPNSMIYLGSIEFSNI